MTTLAVSVVVVTYRSRATIDLLLDSIPGAAPGLDVDVLVVDNASPDGTAEHVRRRGDVDVIDSGGNVGYAAGINLGRERAKPGSVLVIVNPDVVMGSGSMTALVRALEEARVGVTIPLIYDAEGRRFPSLRREPTLLTGIGDALFGSHWPGRPRVLSDTVWRGEDYAATHDADWASGAVWAVSHECDAEVGPWDERFFLYSEETEYARRVRHSGWRLRFVPEAEVTHVGGVSGSSTELDALMELNRIDDFRSVNGAFRSLVFWGTVIFKHALRSVKPKNRAVLRILVSRRRSAAVFRGRPTTLST